jgi:hypothetical protein
MVDELTNWKQSTKIPTEAKSVEEAREQSIQSRATADDEFGQAGAGLLYWMVNAGELIAPWWSKRRDADLRSFWKTGDHISSAFYTMNAKLSSVPVHVEPRDATIKSHIKQADEYTRILVEESEYGEGWINCFGKWLLDIWSQDNGGFFEIIGAGKPDGPIVGPAHGIAHLDSWRVTRTSSPEFPVIYQDTDSKRYKLHHTRVGSFAQSSDPAVEMRGVGFCWASRAINTAQNLIDMGRYKQEKLGSRPMRAMMLGRGITPGTVGSAMAQANYSMDGKNLSRYSQIPFIEGATEGAGIDIIDMASLPDGFDEQTSVTLGMFAIALAGGVPPRWLWPASVTGATKADAMFSHISGLGGMAGQTLAAVTLMLGGSTRGSRHIAGKFLPPHLKLVFDFQDDEQDKQQAEIKSTRAETREREVNSGIISMRVAREQALSSGDITKSQFIEMELDDGKLEDGTSVLTLFSSKEPDIKKLLNLGIPDPLDTARNDSVAMLEVIREQEIKIQDAIINAVNGNAKNSALAALAALKALSNLYQSSNLQPMPQDEPGLDDEPDIERDTKPDDGKVEEEAQLEEDDKEGEKRRPFENKATKGESLFTRRLKSFAAALWRESVDQFEFMRIMAAEIQAGYRQAWRDGAEQCGIKFEELTQAELAELQSMINNDIGFLPGYSQYIVEHNKAEGFKLRSIQPRIQLWINGYDRVRARGHALACADQKEEWFLGATEKHCRSCFGFNGRVYRNSTWEKNGALPKSHKLECGGYYCDCETKPTDKRITPGRFPRSLLQ